MCEQLRGCVTAGRDQHTPVVKEGEGQEIKANGFNTIKMINLPKSNWSIRMFSFQTRGYTIRQVSKRFVFQGNVKVPYVAQMHSMKTRVNAVLQDRFKLCNPSVHRIFGLSHAQGKGSGYLPGKPGRVWKRQSKVQRRAVS